MQERKHDNADYPLQKHIIVCRDNFWQNDCTQYKNVFSTTGILLSPDNLLREAAHILLRAYVFTFVRYVREHIRDLLNSLMLNKPGVVKMYAPAHSREPK